MFKAIMLVGIGGFAGSVARYGVKIITGSYSRLPSASKSYDDLLLVKASRLKLQYYTCTLFYPTPACVPVRIFYTADVVLPAACSYGSFAKIQKFFL